MQTIGIRVEPSTITFVIYDSEAENLVNAEILKVPKALTIPESLKYVRVSIIDILREYQIDRAGIRVTESTAQSTSISRIQIEAIIIEAFASSSLEKYFCGQISTISRLVGIDRADFKKYVNGEMDYAVVDNWSEFSKVAKEACFAAIGATNA